MDMKITMVVFTHMIISRTQFACNTELEVIYTEIYFKFRTI